MCRYLGFAFTLSLPLLFAVTKARRLWIGALMSLGAIFCWANTVRVDRNLQTFLPLLVATTAAIFVRAWRAGALARIGVGALVLSQVVWAGDLWFVGASDRMGAGMALIRTGFDGQATSRFASVSSDHLALDRALPKDAVVLVHHWHPTLGINRTIYLDWVGFQGSIDYRNFSNTRDFYDRLRALGVTHVVHLPGNQAAPSRQEDAIFSSLVMTHAGPKSRFGQFEMFPLPATAPPKRSPLQVLAIGLGGYADGLYDVTALGTNHNLPGTLQHYSPPRVSVDARGPGGLLDASDVVLVGATPRLDAASFERLSREYQAAVPYPGLTVYVRRPTAR